MLGYSIEAGNLDWYAKALGQGLYLQVFWNTFEIAVFVTVFCLLLGYPPGFLIATTTPFWATMGFIFVLLPLWTSVLVRTYAWMVLLGRNGVFNRLLLATGLAAVLPVAVLAYHGSSGLDVYGWMGSLATYGFIVTYALVCAALPRYLRSHGAFRPGAQIIPWLAFIAMVGLSISAVSSWVWTSMKPGATTLPVASISLSPFSEPGDSMAAMRSPLIATSAANIFLPVPSATWPLRMTISYAAMMALLP